MATDAVLAATPHMLRLLVTGVSSEGGDLVNIPQATLVADCAAGPLKELLAAPLFGPSPPAAADWSSMQEDPRLSVTLAGFGATPSLLNNSYQFHVVSSTNVLTVTCDSLADLIIELKFNHSIDR